MTAIKETRQLALHPLAIHTFIKAQAGSLGKALSEAVMNSIDAFAHNITVTVTPQGFSIEDDGQGFKDREEIASWFETLGFPHDEGNHRVYGKFGMGRAQMWAYASTTWYSNQFVMHVDVQKNGLDYDLHEQLPGVKGTRIKAMFYKPITFQEQARIEHELSNLVRYAPALVVVNGKPVSKDPSVEQWTMETDEAYIRIDPSMHSLDVYNGGILVSHFARYRYDCTGVVVTKPEHTLSLNIARNEILAAECPVWAKVVQALPKKKRTEAKAKPTQKDLTAMAARVVAGEISLEKAMQATPGLVTSVLGRAVGFSDLQGWRFEKVVFVPKGDDFGKRLAKLRRALVLANETLDRFGLSSPAELKALVRQSLTGAQYTLDRIDRAVWSDKPRELFKDEAEGKTVYANSELNDETTVCRISWQKAWPLFSKEVRQVVSDTAALDRLTRTSLVRVGDCGTRAVWLSEANEVVLRQAELVKAMTGGLPAMVAYANLVLKEIMSDAYGCPDAGTAAFVRLVTQTQVLGRMALQLSRVYIQEATAKDLPVATFKLQELDSAGVE